MGLRLAVGRVLCHPVVGRVMSAAFRRRVRGSGGVVDTTSPALSPMNVASIFWGLYERSERLLVDRHLRPDLDVVELGASLGLISLAILRRQLPDRRLLCGEANPLLIPTLTDTVERHSSGPSVTVVHGPLDYGGAAEVSFRVDPGNLGSAKERDGGAGQVTVPAVTLGQLLAQHDNGDDAWSVTWRARRSRSCGRTDRLSPGASSW